MRCIAEGEAAFHAGMTLIRAAVLIRHHAHNLVALHLRLKRAANATVGAGGYHAVLGLAVLND